MNASVPSAFSLSLSAFSLFFHHEEIEEHEGKICEICANLWTNRFPASWRDALRAPDPDTDSPLKPGATPHPSRADYDYDNDNDNEPAVLNFEFLISNLIFYMPYMDYMVEKAAVPSAWFSHHEVHEET